MPLIDVYEPYKDRKRRFAYRCEGHWCFSESKPASVPLLAAIAAVNDGWQIDDRCGDLCPNCVLKRLTGGLYA